MVLNWRWSKNRGMFILKIYEWCHWYPVLKCMELLNRGVLNRRDHCMREMLPYFWILCTGHVVCVLHGQFLCSHTGIFYSFLVRKVVGGLRLPLHQGPSCSIGVICWTRSLSGRSLASKGQLTDPESCYICLVHPQVLGDAAKVSCCFS